MSQTSSMKALVTGASGFIGSTLIEELGTLGFEAHALMRRTSSPANLKGLQYRKVEGDLSDLASLRRAVRGMDYVFHLAGMTAALSKRDYFEFNAEGTKRLAQAVAEENPGLARFVYVSSLAAGGPADGLNPREERHEDKPVSAYGQSKRRGEQELLEHKDTFPISIARPPIVYGPKDKGVFVIIQSVARNVMLLPRGATPGGQKYYSAIHVRDLCRGLVQAAVAPKDKVPSGEIFYLCSDEVVSYEELMMTIAEKLGRDPLRIRVPKLALTVAAAGFSAIGRVTRKSYPLNLDKLNEVLPDYWICSNRKAKAMLGFAPEYNLSKGMADAIEWYRRNKWI
jgi:nucleoside-diphosphate-sugar epimerase